MSSAREFAIVLPEPLSKTVVGAPVPNTVILKHFMRNAMKEQSKEIEEIKADLKKMIIVNEMLLTEHKTLLREMDDLKTEVENVKTVNETLSTEMENVKTVNRSLVEKVDKMEKQIEQLLSAAHCNGNKNFTR